MTYNTYPMNPENGGKSGVEFNDQLQTIIHIQTGVVVRVEDCSKHPKRCLRRKEFQKELDLQEQQGKERH